MVKMYKTRKKTYVKKNSCTFFILYLLQNIFNIKMAISTKLFSGENFLKFYDTYCACNNIFM